MIVALGALGLAALTRYAGLAAVPAIVLSVLLFGEGEPLKRLRRGLILSSLTVSPLLIWFLRNWVQTGNPTDRGFAYHPITMQHLQKGLQTVSNWVIPGRITGPARDGLALIIVVAALLLIFFTIIHARRRVKGSVSETPFELLPAVVGTFILSYVLILLISISFFDAQLSLSPRPLSPIYLMGVIALLPLLPLSFKRSAWILPAVVTAGIIVILVFNSVHAAKYITRAQAGSMMMYAGEGWTNAAIIEQVRSLPAGIPIYSNGEDAVYFVTGTPAARLPRHSDPFTGRTNPDFHIEMDRMLEVLTRDNGVIVYFNGITWRDYLPRRDEMEAQFPLAPLWVGEEGVIYGLQ
jgi:hypothetical protein